MYAHHSIATQQPLAANSQYGRFGQPGPQDAATAQQKPLDPFSQQTAPGSQPSAFDRRRVSPVEALLTTVWRAGHIYQ